MNNKYNIGDLVMNRLFPTAGGSIGIILSIDIDVTNQQAYKVYLFKSGIRVHLYSNEFYLISHE